MKHTNIKWFVPHILLIGVHKCIHEYFISLYDLIVGYIYSLITKSLNLNNYSTSIFFIDSVNGSRNQILFSAIKENIPFTSFLFTTKHILQL